MSLDKKEVPEEMEQKILAFGQTQERFTTKDIFEKFPNNQEYLSGLKVVPKVFLNSEEPRLYL